MKIILASSSPRRAEILKQLNINFEINPSNIDENQFKCTSPEELVKRLSFEKAKFLLNNKEKNVTIIGSDTIVVINNEILGKPKNKEDALRMLSLLNGKKHSVLTGLCVLGYKNNVYFEEILYSYANVYFGNYSLCELKKYVETKEPMDKAGAYAIQGFGSFLVEKIEGDYYSIVGLPVQKLYKILNKYDLLKI